VVARRAHNPEVVGSNPTPATKEEQNPPDTNRGIFLLPLPHFFDGVDTAESSSEKLPELFRENTLVDI
jgi:hypothetical protein